MIKPDKVFVLVSGGKDSTLTLALAIKDMGKENVEAVFCDVGWEHPDTISYLDYLDTRLGITITRLGGEDLVSLIRRRKRFPFGHGRFCTSELKSQRGKKHIVKQIDWTMRYEIWLGIRSNESTPRKMKYGKYSFDEVIDCDDVYPGVYPRKVKNATKIRLPILNLTTEQVFANLENMGIKRNPRYDAGDDRVGCYPCLLAGKKSHNHIAETELGKIRIQTIFSLADELGVTYEPLDYDGQCELCKD